MYQKFKPATTEPFPLDYIHHEHFSVSLSKKSCFEGFEQYTPLPCLHLVVAADAWTATWEWWYKKMRPAGVIEDRAEWRMGAIITHFFGNALPLKDAAWRFERDSPGASPDQTIRVHLKIAHRNIFGDGKFMRQCEDTDLKPSLIEQAAAKTHIKKVAEESRPRGWRPSDGVIEVG